MQIGQIQFNKGDIVYEISRPQQLMEVTRYNGNIYYCKFLDLRQSLEMAFMQRDLKKKNTSENDV